METLLHRFRGPSRLILTALLAGGVNGARKVLSKLRAVGSPFSLASFLETLCENEAQLDEGTHELSAKPLVCLFSEGFQRDLLCLLHLVPSAVSRDAVLALLRCFTPVENQKPWVRALIRQLHRDFEEEEPERNPLLTPEGELRLQGLCEKFRDPEAKGGWELCLKGSGTEPSEDGEPNPVPRKRKGEVLDLHVDSDVEPETNRMKVDLSTGEDSESEKVLAADDEDREVKTVPQEVSPSGQQPSTQGPPSVLPENVKAVVPLLKELLESETEWDESGVAALGVLNECDSDQLEEVCGVLCLGEAPEHTLPHFCSLLLTLTPDLSHSAASVLIRNLLLGKVHSLSEAASRTLVTAATSLCGRYPRPTCQALIEPLIKEGQTGGAQAELLCRLVKDCLEPHHRVLVFQMTLVGSWNEALLSVIHALLDSKIELNEDLFSVFVNQLSDQSSRFTTSVKFAKMIMTVLTKFHSHVNAACQQNLSSCISCNQTFLKKSLQAALKRITH